MTGHNHENSREEVRERVREANPIEEVVSSKGIELQKRGGGYVALCPFHQEDTPSFHINPDRQTFKCFGCGEGGDVFTFVSKYDQIEFKDALRVLAERGHILLSLSDNEIKSIPLYDSLEAACQLFQDQLDDSPAQEYLEKRKISQDSIIKFRLGWSKDSWDFLTNMMLEQGHSPQALLEAGLIKARESGGFYDFFRGRVIFPVFNTLGKVVGFGGRVLDDREPKYLNGPETSLYQKGKLLYGLNFAARTVREQGEIIVVEGYTDVIHSHQAGIENVVAVIGTSFTPDHAELLERRFQTAKMTFCYDGDEPGIKAALRTSKNTLGRDAHVCILPGEMDPADILEAGQDLRAEFQKTIPMFEFVFNRLAQGKTLQEPGEKIALLNNIKEYLVNIPEGRRGIYLQTLEKRLGVSTSAIEAALAKPHRQETQGARVKRLTSKKTARDAWEIEFIRNLLSINSPEAIQYFLNELGARQEDFTLPEAKVIFDYLANVDHEIPLLCKNMPLFSTGLSDLINGIVRFGEHQGYMIRTEVLQEIFSDQSQSTTLRGLEQSYLMIRSFEMARQLRAAIKQGRSAKSLVELIKKIEGEIREL